MELLVECAGRCKIVNVADLLDLEKTIRLAFNIKNAQELHFTVYSERWKTYVDLDHPSQLSDGNRVQVKIIENVQITSK